MTTETATQGTDMVRIPHAFERAGLGIAPFVCIGMEERIGPIRTTTKEGITVEIGAPGQPMGTCDYCGTGIALCFLIRSKDGKRFIVGSDCVHRCGDAKLITRVKMEANKRAKLATHARQDAIIAEGRAAFDRPEVKAALAVIPHPDASLAAKGRMAFGWVEFCLTRAGRAGMVKAAKMVLSVAV